MGNCHFKSDFDAENFTGKLLTRKYICILSWSKIVYMSNKRNRMII